MRIQRLPTLVANQIAAGEVIERPASVIKELLENCIDAGANQINIELGYGGLNLIRVVDNGIGIMAEDLPLAIAPHATSKISELKDLYAIASMGFRGEALASIASIAKLKISSKPANQKHAMKLIAEEGSILTLEPDVRQQGTTIEVSDIFFNTPVRKKFLKSERYEYQLIEKIVKRFALSAFSTAISLRHNGKLMLNLPLANTEKAKQNRIEKLLGKRFFEAADYIDIEHLGMHLYGWLSNEDYQLSQNDKQFVYVNSRMVKDKLLNHAIKKAYESILYPGRHPACVLFFNLPTEEVDVNVHPTKHELRFQEPRLIHDFISSSLEKKLNQPLKSELKVEQQAPKQPFLNNFQLAEPKTSLVFKNDLPALKDETNSPWQLLNSHFALVFLENNPFLIDIKALNSAYLTEKITKLSKPWASRPLLVPVSYALEKTKDEAKLIKQIAFLKEIGLELDRGGEHFLTLRSLPIILPKLNLKSFLNAFFAEKNGSFEQIINLLIEHQSFDAKHLDKQERDLLIDFSKSFISMQDNRMIKEFSFENCKEFINA